MGFKMLSESIQGLRQTNGERMRIPLQFIHNIVKCGLISITKKNCIVDINVMHNVQSFYGTQNLADT